MELKVKFETTDKWNKHYKKWNKCKKCSLHKTCKNHVLARGEIPCDIVFIGEAPGKTEDYTGFPFVGVAGRLLQDWIDEVKEQLTKEERTHFTYAITNVLACRPCDNKQGPNRAPMQHETSKCLPRLKRFIKIANPIGIVFLGNIAWEANKVIAPFDLTTLKIYHPSYVVRQGKPQKLTRDCVQQIAQFIKDCKIWQEMK